MIRFRAGEGNAGDKKSFALRAVAKTEGWMRTYAGPSAREVLENLVDDGRDALGPLQV